LLSRAALFAATALGASAVFSPALAPQALAATVGQLTGSASRVIAASDVLEVTGATHFRSSGAGYTSAAYAGDIYSGVLSGTGAFVLSDGTLRLDAKQTFSGGITVTGADSVLIFNTQKDAFNNVAGNAIRVLDGGTLVFGKNDTTNSYPAMPIYLYGASDTVRSSLENSYQYNKLGALFMKNGDLVIAANGYSDAKWRSYSLNGVVTVQAEPDATAENPTVSRIYTKEGVLDPNIHLGANSHGTTTTFMVEANALLDVSSILVNRADNLAASNLTKEGAGKMLITGLNTYTGTTIVSGGILQVGDASNPDPAARVDAGSISTTSGVTIAAGAVVRFDIGTASPLHNSTFGKSISGAGVFQKDGPGKLTIAVQNLPPIFDVLGGHLALTGTDKTTVRTISVMGTAEVPATLEFVGTKILGGNHWMLSSSESEPNLANTKLYLGPYATLLFATGKTNEQAIPYIWMRGGTIAVNNGGSSSSGFEAATVPPVVVVERPAGATGTDVWTSYIIDGNTTNQSAVHPYRNGTTFQVAENAALSVQANLILGSNNTQTTGITKTGAGTLILSGANGWGNLYKGGTTINAGTVELDYTRAGSPATNIIATGTPLTLSGGSLVVKGKAGQNGIVETFSGTTSTAQTNSTIRIEKGAATAITLALGTLAVNGALRLEGADLPRYNSGYTIGTTNYTTTTSAGANDGATRLKGVVLGGAWASTLASGAPSGSYYIVPLSSTTRISVHQGMLVHSTGASTDRSYEIYDGGGTPGAVTISAGAETTIESLLFSATTAGTINNTSCIRVTSGEIVKTADSAMLTIGLAPGDGSTNKIVPERGNVAGTVKLVNNATDPDSLLVVNSAISNPGSNPASLSVSGTAPVVLAGKNDFKGSLTILGPAPVIIKGDNGGHTSSTAASFTGPVTIAPGATLRFSNVPGQTVQCYYNTFAIGAGGTLQVDTDAVTYFLQGAISGEGALVKTGSGGLGISNTPNDTFTGGTYIYGGYIGINCSGPTSSIKGTVYIFEGASLQLNASDATGHGNSDTNPTGQIDHIVLNGGTLLWNNNGNQTFSFNKGGLEMTAGTFRQSTTGGRVSIRAGTPIITHATSAPSRIGPMNFDLRSNDLRFIVEKGTVPVSNGISVDLLMEAVIRDYPGFNNVIQKYGDGLMRLTGTSQYTGGTVINAGTISTNNTAGLGTSPVTLRAGAVFHYDGATPFTLNASTSAPIGNNAAGSSLAGNNPGDYGVIDVSAGSTVVLNTTLGGGAAQSRILKRGEGTLVIGGAGDNNGGHIILDAGRLELNKSANFVAGGPKATGFGDHDFIVNGGLAILTGGAVSEANPGNGMQFYKDTKWQINGGSVDLNGRSVALASLGSTGPGGIVTNASGAGLSNLWFTNNIVNGYHDNETYAGRITGNVGIVIAAGSNRIQGLSGVNTYTGATQITSGTLLLSGAGKLGATPVTVGAAGRLLLEAPGAIGSIASLDVTTAGAKLEIAASQTLSAAYSDASGAGILFSGTGAPVLTFATGATVNAAVSGPGVLAFSGGTSTLANTGNAHTGGTRVLGGATLLFANPAVFGPAGVTLDNGTLSPAGASALNLAATSVTVNAGGGTLNAGAADVSLGAVSGAGTLRNAGSGTASIRSFTSGMIAGGKWLLADGAVLAGAVVSGPGAVASLGIAGSPAGTASLGTLSTPQGVSFHTRLSGGDVSDRYAVTSGAVAFGAGNFVRINTALAGDYTIATAPGGFSGHDNPANLLLVVGAESLGNTHNLADFSVKNSTELHLDLKIVSVPLVWGGDSQNAWDAVQENRPWEDAVSPVAGNFFARGDRVFFTAAGAQSPAVTVGAGVGVSDMFVTGGAYTFSGQGITGSAALATGGAHAFGGAGADSARGALEVSGAGTVADFSGTPLSFAGGVSVAGGARLRLSNGAQVSATPSLTVGGASGVAGILEAGGAIVLNPSTQVSMGLAGAEFSLPGALDRLTIGAGSLSGGGADGVAFTKTGAGVLALSGDNTFTGRVVVGRGTLEIGSGGDGRHALGSPATNALWLGSASSAATLSVPSGADAAVSLGGREVVVGAAGAVFEVGQGRALSIGGALSGDGSAAAAGIVISKTGNGMLEISGDNSLSLHGTIAVRQGALSISSAENLGASSNVILLGNDVAVAISTGGLRVPGSGVLRLANPVAFSGAGGVIDVDGAAGRLVLDGPLGNGAGQATAGSARALTKTGAGTLVLAADSTDGLGVDGSGTPLGASPAGALAGNAAVEQGTLLLLAPGVLGVDGAGQGEAFTPFSLALGSAGHTGRLDIAADIGGGGAIVAAFTPESPFQLGRRSIALGDAGGVIHVAENISAEHSGALSGGMLTKDGLGVLTLRGANAGLDDAGNPVPAGAAHTGAVHVREGTLVLAHAGAGADPLVDAAGVGAVTLGSASTSGVLRVAVSGVLGNDLATVAGAPLSTLEIAPHAGGAAPAVTLRGANLGFSGLFAVAPGASLAFASAAEIGGAGGVSSFLLGAPELNPDAPLGTPGALVFAPDFSNPDAGARTLSLGASHSIVLGASGGAFRVEAPDSGTPATLVLGGAVSGATLVKTGGGRLVLNAQNSFHGLSIEDGVVFATLGVEGLGNGGSPLSLGGASTSGTLETAGSFSLGTRPVSVNAGGGVLLVPSGAAGYDGSGLSSDSTAAVLEKKGAGTFRIAAAQPAFLGVLALSGGTTRLGGEDALANAAALRVENGATAFAERAQSFQSLVIGENSVFTFDTAIDAASRNLSVNALDLGGSLRNATTVTVLSPDASDPSRPGILTIRAGQTAAPRDLILGPNTVFNVESADAVVTTSLGAISFQGLASDPAHGGADTRTIINIASYNHEPRYVIARATDISGGGFRATVAFRDALPGTPAIALPAAPDRDLFLSVDARVERSATGGAELVVSSSLVWESVSPGAAHGVFNIGASPDGTTPATFTLGEIPDILAKDNLLVDNLLATGTGLDGDAAHNPDDASDANAGGAWDGRTLVKRGVGTLVLAGSNAYTGRTIIENGSILALRADSLGAAGADGVWAPVVFDASNGVHSGGGDAVRRLRFDIESRHSGGFSRDVTGDGILEKSGAGRLSIFGALSHSGGTRVYDGTLALAASGSLGGALVLDSSEGGLRGGAGQPAAGSPRFDISEKGAGAVVLLESVSADFRSALLLGAATLQLGSAGTDGAGAVAGVISGAGGRLVKDGAGLLSLSGANTFTGGMELRGDGSIHAGHASALGSGVFLHAGSGALAIAPGLALRNDITLAGGGAREFFNDGAVSLSGRFTVEDGGGAVLLKTGAGELRMENTAALDALGPGSVLRIDAGSVFLAGSRLAASLEGAGALSASLPSSAATFVFSGPAGGYTGSFTMERGVLAADAGTSAALRTGTLRLSPVSTLSVGEGASGAPLGAVVANGGTLRFAFGAYSPAGLLEAESLDLSAGVVARLELSGPLSLSAADPAGRNLFALNAGNPAATMRLASAAHVTAPDALANPGASVSWLDTGGADVLAGPVTRVVTDSPGGARLGTASITYTPRLVDDASASAGMAPGILLDAVLETLTAEAGAVIPLRLPPGADASNAVLQARLRGAGGFAFSGPGVATVGKAGGQNDYSGPTSIDAATLVLGADGALGRTSSLTLTGSAVLDMAGASQDVRSLYGEPGTVLRLGALGVGGSGVFDGLLEGGPGASIVKTGPGTLELSAASPAAPALAVRGGSLVVSGLLGVDSPGATDAFHAADIVLDGGSLVFASESGSQTLSGKLSAGMGAGGSLVKRGGGRLALSNAANTHAQTIAEAGVLAIADGGALGSGVAVLSGGVVLEFSGESGKSYSHPLSIGAGGAVFATPASEGPGFSAAFSAGILGESSTSSITIEGPGEVDLSGADAAYAGETLLRGGTLAIARDSNLGQGGRVFDGGTLRLCEGAALRSTWVAAGGGGAILVDGEGVLASWGGDIFARTGAGPDPAPVTKGGAGTLVVTGEITAPFRVGEGVLAGTGRITDPSFAGGVVISPGLNGVPGGVLRLGHAGGVVELEGVTLRLLPDAGGGVLAVEGDASFGVSTPNTLDLRDAAGVGAANTRRVILTATGSLRHGELAATLFECRGIQLNDATSRHKATLAVEGGSLVLSTWAEASGEMIWTGQSVWDKAGEDWLYSAPGAVFKDGDKVRFNAEHGSRNVDVTSNGGGVLVGQMDVESGEWRFDGGKIAGTNVRTSAPDVTGDGWLYVHAGASAAFGNELEYVGGGISGVVVFERAVRFDVPLRIQRGGSAHLDQISTLDTPGVQLDGELVVTRSSGRSLTLSAPLSGSGSLVLLGDGDGVSGGVIVLSEQNTHTGGTTVSGGVTLSLPSDMPLGLGVARLDGASLELSGTSYAKAWELGPAGGVLRVASADASVLFASPLSRVGESSDASHPLAKEGPGALRITSPADVGPVAVRGGKLVLAAPVGAVTDAGARHAAPLTLAAGAVLEVENAASQTFSGPVTGPGLLRHTGSGDLVLGDASSAAGAAVAAAVSLASLENQRGLLVLGAPVSIARSLDNAGTLEALAPVVLDPAAVSGADSGAGFTEAATLANSGRFSAPALRSTVPLMNTGTLALSAGSEAGATGHLALDAQAPLVNNGDLEARTLSAGAPLLNNGSLWLGAAADPAVEASIGTPAGHLSLTDAAPLTNNGTLRLVSFDIHGGLFNAGIAEVSGSARLASASAVVGSNNSGRLSVAGSLGVTGNFDNSGTLSAADASVSGGTLSNGGTVVISGSLAASVRNEGILRAGSLAGDLENAGYGASATLGGVSGDVLNRGRYRALGAVSGSFANHDNATLNLDSSLAGHSISGALANSGFIHFDSFGQELRAGSLSNAAPGSPGHYSLEIVLGDTAASDRITLPQGAAVTGTHIFTIRTVRGGENATKSTTHALATPEADYSRATLRLAAPVEAGLYSYGLVDERTPVLGALGYSSAAKAAVNSATAPSTAWFSQLDNIHSRLGEFRAPAAPDAATPEAPAQRASNAVWLRAHSAQINASPAQEGLDPYRQYQHGADVGYDHAFATHSAARLYLGVGAGYQMTRADVRASALSRAETASATVGAYATWVHDAGWFADLYAKGQYTSADISAPSVRADYATTLVGASIELGKRFTFGAGWYLEPAVQFAYSRHLGTDYTLPGVDAAAPGVPVHHADSDTYRFVERLRVGKFHYLGARFGHIQPHLEAALERQDSDGGQIRAGDERFNPTTDGLRGHFGAGLSWHPTAFTQFTLSYAYTFGDAYRRPYSISISARTSF
jgi:autotransporter-associated beta strand protein